MVLSLWSVTLKDHRKTQIFTLPFIIVGRLDYRYEVATKIIS